MKKVSRTSPSRGVSRPERTPPASPRPVRRFRPRFGPEPVPQPLRGRFGPLVSALQIRRRRSNSVQRRVGKGAAAPLRFVFVRRSKTTRGGALRRSVAPVTTPIQIRKEASRGRGARKRIKPDLSPPAESKSGMSAIGELPWVQRLMASQLDPESIPQGLPEMPSILLEGDPVVLESAIRESGPGTPALAGTRSAVWLTGCDPRTLLLGWEEPSQSSLSTASPTEWRLRSLTDPDSILAAGALPEDRRFLFLQDPPQAAGHIADIGTRSPQGRWECLASSGPVSLPPSSVSAEAPPTTVPPQSLTGIRPGVSASYFHQILNPQRRFLGPSGSSELGLPAVSGRLGQGANCGGAPSSDVIAAIPFPEMSSSALGVTGLDSGLPPEECGFRVNAEVVLFGSTRPGSRVTIFGRPVELRPDGSFTVRCALPDGRFEVPIQTVCPQGDEVRKALLTLARQTTVEGGIGAHPTTPGLPLPDAIP